MTDTKEVHLRPYQEACRDAVIGAKEEGLERVLYVMATGTGKTRVAASIIDAIRKEDKRPALVLAHRDELLTQAEQAITRYCPGVWTETEKGASRAQGAGGVTDIVIGSIQTLAREGSSRLSWLSEGEGPSVIWVDEGHHAPSDGYGRVLERFGGFDGRSFVVGCTATPKRLDRRALVAPNGDATFQKQVFDYPLKQAIRDGYLCPIRGVRVVTDTDISGVGTTAGDFNQKALSEAVDNETRTEKAIEHWEEVAGDRVTLAFCVDIAHSRHTAEAWRKAGYKALHIDGAMPLEERRDALRRWRAGEVQIVTNCGVATEGFDFPAINCVVMLRPTQSWTLYAQCVGRGTRLSEETGKEDCIILDVVDNTTRHDLAAAPTLMGLPSKLDLQGNSVLEASDAWEEAAAAGGMKQGKVPKTFEELVEATKVVPVDLLGTLTEEVRQHSRLYWQWAGGSGSYVLSAGRYGDGTPKIARLLQDTLGQWRVEIPVNPAVVGDRAVRKFAIAGSLLLPDFREADSLIERVWPKAVGALLRQDAGWRKDPATPKQIGFLRAKGIPETTLIELSKGAAAGMIGQLMIGMRGK